MLDEIKCDLVLRPEYIMLGGDKEKYGKYLSSCFWDVPEFGSKSWGVGVYIEVDDYRFLDDPNAVSVARRCVEFLNTPPPRAKYSKKKPKPKYGTLELYNAKYVNKGGKTLISAIVITNEKKNRSFWGKGVNV
ncbi:MAG: hypothetical protein HOJ16_07535 [Candidatus Peribacter sp.]|jgi:hypothetical protein|nr:hypothetical protein [Candidatus Peribacter sp.]MBT6053237.1 hypothetical protein [Candidatus Scalindua sp.]MDB4335924.1 hypothetical protein [bacterium]